MTVPLTLLVDDGCPLVHVYRYHTEEVHHRPPMTKDGRRMPDLIPNDFLDRFCDVCDEQGIAGKFSIVPSPAGRGDIVNGIEGHDPELTREWLDTVQRRLGPRFDFSSEGITHNLTLDLGTGTYLDLSENDWSQTQSRDTLTPYLIHQLELLKAAGVNASGITSPWVFGQKVEPEYIAAMVEAQRAVYGREISWYFLHCTFDRHEQRPWIAYREGETALVSIPANVDDYFWADIDSPRTDQNYIHSIADRFLSRDGRSGSIREVLDAGGWPILVTHWQSLFSCGLETGLAALNEVGRRVKESLGEEVRWTTCMELTRMTLEDKGRDEE